jgi:hypothetical protein
LHFTFHANGHARMAEITKDVNDNFAVFEDAMRSFQKRGEATRSTASPANTSSDSPRNTSGNHRGIDMTISAEYLDRLDLAAELTEAARDLDAPPSYEAGNHIKCRGEELTTPIYWQGRQWAVTPFGIECPDGTYVIARSPLGKRRPL